ncbi:RHS repeat-associated core domain-containing protein [Desulfurivibrio sp. D14AmB]|uniref:RHS repeat-associated core domain-containing protein n=1 Tax=Desulfurivibrio sp. D14AmB TaxID=3374370 RepID=UPI00376F0835
MYTPIGDLLNFAIVIDPSTLDPGEHALTVYLQDIFGVHCYYPRVTHYTNYASRLGDIVDQQTIFFTVPEPGTEGCCELDIENFNGGGTVNVSAGQAASFSADITGSPSKAVNWELELVAAGGVSSPGVIATGSGRKVSTRWSGRAADGTQAEPGNYTAVLRAWAVDDPNCQDTATVSLRVDWDANCNLLIAFGSRANIASGNLSHRQPLFAGSGSGPVVDLNLYYNSLDPHAGVLGRGWSHSYELLLRELADGSVLIKMANGDRKLYTATAEGYLSPRGDYSLLSRDDDGAFTLKQKAGTVHRFTAAGRLAAIEDRNGNTLSLVYEGGQLVALSDPAGRVTGFAYDNTGRLAAITDPAGRDYSFEFSGNRLAKVVYPDGGSWNYSYDARGFLLGKTDRRGFTTSYAYDDRQRVTGVTDPEGRKRVIEYPQPDDEAEQTALVTEKDGGVWRYTYDSVKGDLVEKEDPLGGITRYLYDDHHNLLTRTDPDGGTTSYSYDENGNPLSITDPLGQRTRYSYNDFGQVTGITDPAGETSEFRYDQRGNLTATVDPTGAVTSYQVDGRGNVIAITDPAGLTTAMTHDAAGNLLTITDPAGGTTRFEYDGVGRLLRQIDPQGQVASFEYDSNDNLVKITDPLGHVTTFTHDAAGNLLTQTDANGNTSRYEYNAQGQLVKMIDAEGFVTTFSHGGEGCATCSGGGTDRLTALTDAKGQTTLFAYDQLGRLLKVTDPLDNATNYKHDAKGRVISRTDANGNTINHRHDALGRLVKKSYPDGSEVTFTYDARGNILTAANRHIGYSFTYDAAGRMTGVVDSYGRVIEYRYDQAGRRTRMISPDGRTISYRYNTAGQLAAIDDGEAFSFTYDELGRRTTLAYPNGMTADYDYDNAGRLTALVHRDAAGEALLKSIYELDKIGNRLGKTTERFSIGYDYDRIYRLREAVQSTPGFSPENERGGSGRGIERAAQKQKEHYDYDPVGNRLASHLAKSYSHNAANQLLATNRTQYAYDHNGNLVRKETPEGVTTYQWDYENRLIRVNLPDGARVEFAYDPFGRRIEKQSTGQKGKEVNTTRYVYDGQDILFETDETGAIGNRYLPGPGIDQPLALHQGRHTYYYHADGLGSITALTDQRGRVVQDYHYDSFGNPRNRKNRIKQPYTFTAREYDRETGLYYYRARYYDAPAGRFISKDPIGFAGDGPNLYAYVLNNPANVVDPTGLKCGTLWNDWAVPDSWWGSFCFERACGEHDDCYARCGSTKSQCDEEFRKNMLAACEGLNGTMKIHCKSIAGSYYSAVRTLGQSAYNQAQKCCE